MLGLAALLAGYNPGSYPVDIFPEMHYQPNHRPLRAPRDYPAADAVPVTGGRVHYAYAEARDVKSPVQENAAANQRATALYSVNCAVCHGASGGGDGPMAKYFQNSKSAPLPPTDLTSDRVRRRTDGELYWIVANGMGNMPAFGDQLSDQDLWTAVLAIRNMQGQP